jgi:hypothetical protein
MQAARYSCLQERCIAAVERANGAEAREAALAEEKAQLKAGMKVAFARQEELEESLAAASADAADLRTQVGRTKTTLQARSNHGLRLNCHTLSKGPTGFGLRVEP